MSFFLPTRRNLCRRAHCEALATIKPVIRIPTIGRGIDANNDLTSGPMNFPLCEYHFGKFSPGELLTKKAQAKVAKLFTSGSAKPDFARAYKQKSFI